MICPNSHVKSVQNGGWEKDLRDQRHCYAPFFGLHFQVLKLLFRQGVALSNRALVGWIRFDPASRTVETYMYPQPLSTTSLAHYLNFRLQLSEQGKHGKIPKEKGKGDKILFRRNQVPKKTEWRWNSWIVKQDIKGEVGKQWNVCI